MMEFFIWYLVTYGFGVLLAYSSIMEPVRNWFAKGYNTSKLGKWGWTFMNCPMCSSFWAGLIIAGIGVTTPVTGMIANQYITMVLSGLCALASTFLTQTLIFETFAQKRSSGCGCSKKQQAESEEE